MAKTGDIIEGRYRIIKTLGAGGMGTVFLAEHALIKRRVAIKILHAELATDANVVDRFMNEARAAGTLGHPNIVESTDMGFTHDHVPYIVFEYLEGSLLTDEIYRVGGLPVRRTVRICAQIASALHAAHNAGIVHRDLKSDNVFLTDKDDAIGSREGPRLRHLAVHGDRRSSEGHGDGHAGVHGARADHRSRERRRARGHLRARRDHVRDARRRAGRSRTRTIRSSCSTASCTRRRRRCMRPEVPHGLAEIILDKMMAKNPADRYESMADVEAALETFMTRGDGTPLPVRRTQSVPVVVDARKSSGIPRPVRSANTPRPGSIMPLSAKRPYALYAMAGGGVMVGVIGLVVALRSSSHETVAAREPQAQPLPAAALSAPREAEKIPVELEADVAGREDHVPPPRRDRARDGPDLADGRRRARRGFGARLQDAAVLADLRSADASARAPLAWHRHRRGNRRRDARRARRDRRAETERARDREGRAGSRTAGRAGANRNRRDDHKTARRDDHGAAQDRPRLRQRGRPDRSAGGRSTCSADRGASDRRARRADGRSVDRRDRYSKGAGRAGDRRGDAVVGRRLASRRGAEVLRRGQVERSCDEGDRRRCRWMSPRPATCTTSRSSRR